MNSRKPVIGVIGQNQPNCSREEFDFGLLLGRYLSDEGYLIATGGMFGIMEAVCQGARNSPLYVTGSTIGFIPAIDKNLANPFCDIVIPTGMGLSRSILLVNSSDILIAVGGGASTLSEIGYAWQTGKTVLCCRQFEGWSKNLANQSLDNRVEDLLISVNSIDDIRSELKNRLR
mgnify:FL=1